MTKTLPFLKVCLLFLATCFSLASSAQTAYTLQILHASDLEGGVEAIERARYFAAIVDTLEETYPNSITLSAGDNYIPGPFFNAAADRATFRDGGVFNNIYNNLYGTNGYNGLREEGGRADITIMNIIGFDASAVGNHEFDAGADAFEQIIEEDFRSPVGPASDRWVGAQFPYLSSNLDFTQSGDLGNLYTDDVLENTTFRTGPAESLTGNSSFNKIAAATYITRGGEKIGVVGATTPTLATISSPGEVTVKGSTTNDMQLLANLIQPWVDSLTINEGVNKVILVTHLQQVQLEETLAGFLSDVDVIIAGGSDAILANSNDRLNAGDVPLHPYPLMKTNADGDPLAIVSTDGEYSYVGRLVLDFDANGVIIPANIDSNISGPYIADSMMVASTWGNFNNAFADATSKGALVDFVASAVQGVVIAKDGNIFGETNVYLNGERTFVRSEETNFGDLSADANLWLAQQYDPNVVVSIKNGGGIRASIGEVVEVAPGEFDFFPPQANPLSGKQAGEISQLDIENTLRFNNGLSVIDLTADGLKQTIEHAIGPWAPGATPGQFCQVGGLEFSFDPAQSAGSRIQSMVIVDDNGDVTDTIVRGGAVNGDPNRMIKIVTLDFIAGGGDGYPFPMVGTNRVDLDTVSTLATGVATFSPTGKEQDALAEYLAAIHPSGSAYDEEDEGPEVDERIQILSIRHDAIFGVGVSFSNSRMTVDESAGTATISVDYDNASPNNQDVTIEVSNFSSVVTADGNLSSLTETAMANTNGTLNFTYTITDDNEAESDEILFLEIVASLEYYVADGDNDYFVLFVDDNDNPGPTATKTIELRPITSYDGISGSTEILDYDAGSERLFVTNADNAQFEILDFSDPENISIINSVDISNFGEINSLSVHDGVVACAIEGASTMDAGTVAFYDINGTALSNVSVGVLPDMVTFNHSGDQVLVACEGEPNDDYDQDPEGSVAVIDVSGGAGSVTQADVTLLNFNVFDSQLDQLRAIGVRIFGPGASVSQDLEPEYIAVTPDDNTAYVICQENNAFIVIDLNTLSITNIRPLGWKDHSVAGNGFDTDRGSDEIHLATGPFRGFYHPDAIAAFREGGVNYIITANEGDARDYDGYSEEERFDDLPLDPTAFPNHEMLLEAYGDMKVTLANGDTDGDGDYDQVYTYGARSFSIWNGASGELVYDSGDDMERIVKNHPEYFKFFNTSGDGLTIKNRSDDKGPEPEAVVVADLRGTHYAFIGLERTGGVMVYDVSNPSSPVFVDINIPRDTATGGGDLGPEGLIFIPRDDTGIEKDLLVAANEVSSTITVWEVFDTTQVPDPSTSIKELTDDSDILVYPNPAKDKVVIASENGIVQSVELYDLNGRKVRAIETPKPLQVLRLEGLTPNVYLLKAIAADGSFLTKKIVVQ